MSAPILVDDLINQVRDQIDERNAEAISDTDILQALNRAQDYAADILARQYPDPLLTYIDIPLIHGQAEYDMPETAFEDRILKIEVIIRGIHYELKRIKYSQLSSYEIPTPQQIPSYYCMVGPKFRIVPSAIGGHPLRIWYLQEPEALQVSQGRVTNINTVSNYIRVDAVGSLLTTVNTNNYNYINLIDSSTGLVKASLQIQSIVGDKLTFKAIPDRTSVAGKTIVGTIPATLEEDDYVSVVFGSCVPRLKKPFSNFVVQYATVEIKRRLGDATSDMEQNVLREFEKQVERTWVGREQQLRVTKRSRNWLFPRRRLYV